MQNKRVNERNKRGKWKFRAYNRDGWYKTIKVPYANATKYITKEKEFIKNIILKPLCDMISMYKVSYNKWSQWEGFNDKTAVMLNIWE